MEEDKYSPALSGKNCIFIVADHFVREFWTLLLKGVFGSFRITRLVCISTLRHTGNNILYILLISATTTHIDSVILFSILQFRTNMYTSAYSQTTF